MSADYLLVPMQLDALVLNREAQAATPFLRFRMEYEKLQNFNSPEPDPFTPTMPRPGAGIYLHWTLPKSLRHGVHQDDGTTTFPLIPNRWLVVRTDAGPPASVKAWVLESDVVDPEANSSTPGRSPYIDPTGADPQGRPKTVYMGRASRLTPALTSLDAQTTPFLKAVGPGSVTFSLYSPGIDNILSFYDDVTANDDTTPVNNTTFTYSVIGWHSDPAHDPIANPNLEWVPNPDPKLPDTYVLQWKAGTAPADVEYSFDWYVYATSVDLPTKSLVHALVSGVTWNRNADNPPAPGYPTDIGNKVKVAFGHTSIDALAGIVRLDECSWVEADLLEAFQYGLLDKFDEPGSAEALNTAIRERWYGASSGGTLWQIVPAENTDTTGAPAPAQPTITPMQRTGLAGLNALQYEQDRQQRILESMQWTLFSLWWKSNWQAQPDNMIQYSALADWLPAQLPLQVGVGSSCTGNPVGNDPDQEAWYICKVKAQQNVVAQAQDAVKTAGETLTNLLKGDGLVLKAVNQPQYYFPNDPVVLITGLGRSTNFDPADGLLCRVPEHVIAELSVDGMMYLPHEVPLLLDPNHLLPPGVQELHIESFFLSPALFSKVTGTQIAHVRTAIAALTALGPNLDFPPPSFARPEWTQPWVPLLLDWSVTAFSMPGYTVPTDDTNPHLMCTFNQSNWQFTGTDYQWVGPKTAGSGNFDESVSPLQMTGRTFITPHLNFTLADQLHDYVTKHHMRDPNLEALLEKLDAYVTSIANQDILSQRLSGFMAMLIQRQFIQNVAPSGDIAAVLGQVGADASRDFRHGYPMFFPSDHSTMDAAVFDFAPMAGTFFVITGLTVIDTFGRSIDLLQANYSYYNEAQKEQKPGEHTPPPEDFFFPITGRDLQAKGIAKDPTPTQRVSNNPAERSIMLPPAFVQDSRLDIRLLSNDGKDTEIDRSPSNPICGWIVPNHLDRSLALYAPDGTAWGELFLSKRAESHYVPSWQSDPTNPATPDLNPYVSAMLSALSARTDQGVGFYDFMRVIDETLWTINPRGRRQDQDLSVLIGRPLAIVRARISLKLRGLPFYSQDWWNTFDVDPANLVDPSGATAAAVGAFDGGVRDYLWPVRIGSQALRDDGVIGYFVDNPATPEITFNVFNTVMLPADLKTDYLQLIGPGNYLRLRLTDDTVSTPDPTKSQVCDITMLVDPRGHIHAYTGLLPVVTVDIPSEFVTPALQKMAYLFRSGPFLTSPDVVRIPRPAERNGQWSWFDHVTNATVDLTAADGKVRLETPPPLAKEGWLKFVPAAPANGASKP